MALPLKNADVQIADALDARAARRRKLVDVDVLRPVVAADAHPDEADRRGRDDAGGDHDPVPRVPAIEHFEHGEHSEHDRLAESGEETGDAEDDLEADHRAHRPHRDGGAASRRRIRNRMPSRAVSMVVMI